MGALTSHIVGFVGGSADIDEPDRVGLAGAEQQYEALLKGARGKYVFLVDKRRYPIGLDTQKSTPARDGSSIILTIDSTIQEFARSSLLKQIQAYQAESGVAIVMNPWNGAILALVSWPDFDPAAFSKTDADRLRNRAVADPFEPGSIFKPIVAAAALDRGLLQKTDRIFCENGYYEKYRIGEWAGHQFGYLTVKEILTESSNIGMAKIGQKMGQKASMTPFASSASASPPASTCPARMPEYSPQRATGRHLPSHASPTATRSASRPCRSSAPLPYLQTAAAPSPPYIVRAVVDDAGNVTELSRKSNLAGRLIKQEVAEWIVREALTNVVKEGTGQEAALEKWQAWGKTGTANIATNGRYDTVNYTACLSAAPQPTYRRSSRSLPSANQTRPCKGYSGGRVAAPVFREIMRKR